MALPLIPHSETDPECCGCLFEIVGEQTQFICNECGAVVSKDEVARIVLRMESCDAKCPHCGRISRIDGFSQVSAFRCRHCGKGVSL